MISPWSAYQVQKPNEYKSALPVSGIGARRQIHLGSGSSPGGSKHKHAHLQLILHPTGRCSCPIRALWMLCFGSDKSYPEYAKQLIGAANELLAACGEGDATR